MYSKFRKNINGEKEIDVNYKIPALTHLQGRIQGICSSKNFKM